MHATTAQFFMLECVEPPDWDDSAMLRAVPRPPGEDSWRFGRPFKTQPKQPIEVMMVPTHCDRLKELYKIDALLMTRRLYDCLREAGVDNIDAYDTLIRHPGTGFESRDYVAGNLVGLVAAADLDGSKIVGGSANHRLDTDFDVVKIDPAKARGLQMFRLAENTSAVVVSRKVKELLEARNFTQLTFIAPESWMG